MTQTALRDPVLRRRLLPSIIRISDIGKTAQQDPAASNNRENEMHTALIRPNRMRLTYELARMRNGS